MTAAVAVGGREKMCGGVEVGHKEKTMNKEKKKGTMNSEVKKRKDQEVGHRVDKRKEKRKCRKKREGKSCGK